MHSATRDWKGAHGRSVVAYLARRIVGYTVKEIADHFKRSVVTMGEWIIEVEDLVRGDKSFERALKQMEENVVKGRKRRYRVTVA